MIESSIIFFLQSLNIIILGDKDKYKLLHLRLGKKVKRPNPYINEGDSDINFIMAGAVEFNPSLILLKKIRMNKIEGFFFGLFFTFLSISISILTSNIYYLFLALILFGLSFSSVGLVYIHSELMFSQKYVINAYGLGLIRGKVKNNPKKNPSILFILIFFRRIGEGLNSTAPAIIKLMSRSPSFI